MPGARGTADQFLQPWPPVDGGGNRSRQEAGQRSCGSRRGRRAPARKGAVTPPPGDCGCLLPQPVKVGCCAYPARRLTTACATSNGPQAVRRLAPKAPLKSFVEKVVTGQDQVRCPAPLDMRHRGFT